MATVLTIQDVAKYIIWKCKKDKQSLTPKTLQKILYYVQAYSVYDQDDNDITPADWKKGTPIFEEQPEAWIHGAVYRTIYNDYRQYGFSDLTDEIEYIDKADIEVIINDEPCKNIINQVLELCKKLGFNADKLEALNHQEEAWIEARSGLGKSTPTNKQISLEAMKKYRPKLDKSFKL